MQAQALFDVLHMTPRQSRLYIYIIYSSIRIHYSIVRLNGAFIHYENILSQIDGMIIAELFGIRRRYILFKWHAKDGYKLNKNASSPYRSRILLHCTTVSGRCLRTI